MRSLLGTLLVFIFAAAAPSAVTAQSISVDQGCYTMDSQGSVTIVVTFTNDANAAASDWIGIVPADQASNALTNVDAWVFTCGDTSCTSVASQGVAPLQATLAQVDWKAVLSRSANSPYMAYAVSTSFSIGSVCGTGSGGLLPNASASLSQPAIQVSSGTFLVGETITVSYQLQGSSSGVDDFIGIFPSSINSNQLLNEGLLWKLLCNRQGQNCPTSAIPTVGTVKFSGSSASWHQASDWPLQVGTYRAYLLQNNVALSFWPVMAQSDTFTITTNTINDNERALLHITDARSAIESLIRSDDTLAPKFLRMGFHDCIGGCDGCIDMSNPANLGMAKPMNALNDVVNQHALDGVSRADIWALAATVGADVKQDPSSRIEFPFTTWGRVNCENTGLPCFDENGNSVTCNATAGWHRVHPGDNMFTADVYQFFADQFGFNQTDTITIMGAHTIGTLATAESGIDGPNGWVLKNKVFDNGYYAEVIGGNDPNTDSTDTLGNTAPPWVRFSQNNSGTGFPDQNFWMGAPNGVHIVMLNSDIALFRVLDSSNMDASLGKVSCTFTNATSNPPALQVCPFSADALRTGSEFKADNMKWLNNFQNVLDRMLTRGYTLPPTCQDPVCKLQKA